jgi:hypothetical protein
MSLLGIFLGRDNVFSQKTKTAGQAKKWEKMENRKKGRTNRKKGQALFRFR